MSSSPRVTARLTDDQYELLRRRLFVEDLSIQTMLSALVNAYIMGDVSVTAQGRYMLSPPSGYTPVVEVEKSEDVVEIEPDWGVEDGRPQVGATSHRQKPRTKPEWGTRELAYYLRKSTGRRVSIPNLRKLLNATEIEKADNGRWTFEGPDDPNVGTVKQAVEEGVYDALVREGVHEARKVQEQKQVEEDELEFAIEETETNRRIQHLKRLRKVEES